MGAGRWAWIVWCFGPLFCREFAWLSRLFELWISVSSKLARKTIHGAFRLVSVISWSCKGL